MQFTVIAADIGDRMRGPDLRKRGNADAGSVGTNTDGYKSIANPDAYATLHAHVDIHPDCHFRGRVGLGISTHRTDGDSDSVAGPNRDASAYANEYARAHGDVDADATAYCHHNTGSNERADRHRYPEPDRHIHPHSHGDSYTYTNLYPYSRRDRDRNTRSDYPMVDRPARPGALRRSQRVSRSLAV